MQLQDLFIYSYKDLHGSSRIASVIFPPLRAAIRSVANLVLPKYLSRDTTRKSSNKSDIIVSLTSFPDRIDTVWQVIECMKRQTLHPYKIILWLSNEQFHGIDSVPQKLRDMQNDTFEIHFVDKDIRSHKKYQYVCRAYPNNLVLLIDDDIYYPSSFLERFYNAFLEEKSVVVEYGCMITYKEDGTLEKYSKWPTIYKENKNNDFFFGSGGGMLFCPALLSPVLTNIELALDLCPCADDVWLNAVVRLSDQNIHKLQSGLILPVKQKTGSKTLAELNVGQDKNDEQIFAVNQYFKKYYNKIIF